MILQVFRVGGGLVSQDQQFGSGPYNFPISGLFGDEQYQIKALALNSGGATLGSTTITVTTAEGPYLIAINGQSIGENTLLYVNQYEYTLFSQLVRNTVNYRWEFSKTSDFTNFQTFNSGTSPQLNLRAIDLESGEKYYVRITSLRQNGTQVTGVIRSFYNALHPVTLYAPATSNKGTARLWTAPVGNDEFALFQIDDDPDFGSPHINPNNLGYGGNNGGGNSTYPFIPGNVFKSNSDWYWNSSTQSGCFEPRCGTLSSRTFSYVAGLLTGTYYVRVRAVNLTSGQTGYWSTVGTISVTVPPIQPPVFGVGPVVSNPPTTYSNLDPRYIAFGIANDPNYIRTGLDIQISKDNFVTTELNIVNNLTSTFEIRNLQYNTTYKARARSYIKNNLNQNVVATDWYTITFTTKASPTGRISSEELASAQGAETNKIALTQVYPNPFASATKLIIHPDLYKAQIRVTNAVGSVVEQFEAFGGETIELGEKWQKGMYIIQVINPDGNKLVNTYKIMKQ
jgi:hypothetical protein